MNGIKIYLKKFVNFMVLVTIVGLSISFEAKDESNSEMNNADETILSNEIKEVTTDVGTVAIYNTAEISSILITKIIKKISIKPLDADAKDDSKIPHRRCSLCVDQLE